MHYVAGFRATFPWFRTPCICMYVLFLLQKVLTTSFCSHARTWYPVFRTASSNLSRPTIIRTSFARFSREIGSIPSFQSLQTWQYNILLSMLAIQWEFSDSFLQSSNATPTLVRYMVIALRTRHMMMLLEMPRARKELSSKHWWNSVQMAACFRWVDLNIYKNTSQDWRWLFPV